MGAYLKVKGGNVIGGKLKVSGAKNSSLFIIIAALLSKKGAVIENVPNISDVKNILKIINNMGVKNNWNPRNNSLELYADEFTSFEVDTKLGGKMRASFALLAPLLYRVGEITFPHPGGDKIGERPIDYILELVSYMGVVVNKIGNKYHLKKVKDLVGIDVTLRIQSYSCIMVLMMLGAVAKGKTIIRNATREPEFFDLAKFLQSMGARISGVGTNTITIDGIQELDRGYSKIMPDRLQVGSYITLSLMTKGTIYVIKEDLKYMEKFIELITEVGAKVNKNEKYYIIESSNNYKAIDFETGEYPKLPTDLQEIMLALTTVSEGKSHIRENLFDSRFKVINELRKIGVDAELISKKDVVVNGETKWIGFKNVEGTDIRGTMALVLCAASMAKGEETYIHNFYHIERGYSNFIETISDLGGEVELVQDHDFSS